ncbi:hypothetical protein KF946_10180 [Idiomarina loihiensis]|uniref:hypothetical protein n=1 Tax=Idiomarina loihiensis TaxID=135577 RepID=UPI00129D07F9|nr:hypothetical protein [Idiomarina loihiensis]MRJ44598.1 hypothetical protein [Idiomarina loihiensis]UTW32376.1 hypothetical protein KF946_10180 [Idiomarina loihiensis]
MPTKLFGLILMSTVLIGCNDSDSETEVKETQVQSNKSPAEQPSNEPETRTIKVSGKVIFEEGVGNVEVCADLKRTLACSSKDPKTTTNPDGSYELSWESEAPHLGYNLVASWPREDPLPRITETLAPYWETVAVGARDIYDGVINPLTTAELSVEHAMSMRDYTDQELQEGLDKLREIYADIYNLPANEVYTKITESGRYADTMAIQSRLGSHTIGLVTDPLAPAHVARELKDEMLDKVDAENTSVQRYFIRNSKDIKKRVRETLIELGYLTES